MTTSKDCWNLNCMVTESSPLRQELPGGPPNAAIMVAINPPSPPRLIRVHPPARLGTRRTRRLVAWTAGSSALVHHLWHRNIQNLHHGHHVGDVLHGAQLDPLLWSPRLGQAGRPHLPRDVLLTKQLEERLGASVVVARRTPHAPLSRPLPSSDLVRHGAGTRQGPLRRSGVRATGTARAVGFLSSHTRRRNLAGKRLVLLCCCCVVVVLLLLLCCCVVVLCVVVLCVVVVLLCVVCCALFVVRCCCC